MTKSSRFTKLFGQKSIIAGVYPTYCANPVELMVREISVLAEHKISGIYLENIHGTPDDLINIETVLQRLEDFDLGIKVGVNILPNHHGKEHIKAFELAKNYGLDFIVLDMLAGAYMINNDIMEIRGNHYVKTRKRNSDVLVIGGICPPYAQLLNPRKLDSYIKLADNRSDALMVKVESKEREIPLERIEHYADVSETEAIVVASKVHTANARKYFRAADACIIGSGLRVDGCTENPLCTSSIKRMVSIAKEERERQ